MGKAQNSLRKTLNKLVDADMVFWLMPPLMVLLIAGTLAQRWLGLWPAIDQYFSTFIIWLGPLPLPGAYTLLGIFSLNLILKFLLKSEWKWGKSGIILSHLGAIILLFGGWLTAITAQETYMLIREGQTTSNTFSYSQRELLIFDGEDIIARQHFDDRKNWQFGDLPFDLKLTNSCENCEILKRQETDQYDENATYQSMAQFMAFVDKPLDPQPETNLPGVELAVTGTNEDGIYVAFDGMPQPVTLTVNDKTYRILLSKALHTLPFEIQLNDFAEERYGGTDKAKSFHSDIIVRDDSLEWPYRIAMNEPLTYRGYTFFQSSFEKGPDYEATVLAVVQNKGRLFPYIGTIIMGIGLLLHCLLVAYPKNGRKP